MRPRPLLCAFVLALLGLQRPSHAAVQTAPDPVSAQMISAGKLMLGAGGAAILGPVLVEGLLQALAAELGGSIASLSGPAPESPSSSAVLLGDRRVLIGMGVGAVVAAGGGALLLGAHLRDRRGGRRLTLQPAAVRGRVSVSLGMRF